jgi:hypothetical protein
MNEREACPGAPRAPLDDVSAAYRALYDDVSAAYRALYEENARLRTALERLVNIGAAVRARQIAKAALMTPKAASASCNHPSRARREVETDDGEVLCDWCGLCGSLMQDDSWTAPAGQKAIP